MTSLESVRAQRAAVEAEIARLRGLPPSGFVPPPPPPPTLFGGDSPLWSVLTVAVPVGALALLAAKLLRKKRRR